MKIIPALLFLDFFILVAISWGFYCLYMKKKVVCDEVIKQGQIVLSFLHEIGTAFTEAIDLTDLLRSVVDFSTKILNANAGALFLVDDTGKELKASVVIGNFPLWHKPEKHIMEKIVSRGKYLEGYLKAHKVPVGSGLIGSVAETKKSCLISDGLLDARIPEFSEEILQVRTMILVPLKIRDDVLGVLALANKNDEKSFNETDLNLLESLADQAALAIRNARYYKTIVEKHKLDRDLNIARDIQKMLLPKECPTIDDWDIAVWSESAMEIGGDYYDFIDVGKNSLGVAIADVSGKSIPGALMMGVTRSILRSKAIGVNSASNVLMSVNELICNDIEQDMFISLLYLIINLKKNEVICARAGHEPMIVYKSKSETCELIKASGMVLGMDDGSMFNNSLREAKVQMESGDVIVLYTDGITEAMNSKEEEFGLDNLLNAIRTSSNLTADEIVNNISQRISRFTGNIPQHDDLTLIVMKMR